MRIWSANKVIWKKIVTIYRQQKCPGKQRSRNSSRCGWSQPGIRWQWRRSTKPQSTTSWCRCQQRGCSGGSCSWRSWRLPRRIPSHPAAATSGIGQLEARIHLSLPFGQFYHRHKFNTGDNRTTEIIRTLVLALWIRLIEWHQWMLTRKSLRLRPVLDTTWSTRNMLYVLHCTCILVGDRDPNPPRPNDHVSCHSYWPCSTCSTKKLVAGFYVLYREIRSSFYTGLHDCGKLGIVSSVLCQENPGFTKAENLHTQEFSNMSFVAGKS